jgi:hypothetical protein
MSGFSTFYYSIDGHELQIIEVDGVCTYMILYSTRSVKYLPIFFSNN